MIDNFGREIKYLRVSVTDRCNLRCEYCTREINNFLSPQKILSFPEIIDIIKIAVELGIKKVRITGGEPLLRNKIVDLVGMVASIPGISDFAMTTNGILLAQHAKDLKNAGLHRINVSLDTLDPEYYKKITRGGDIQHVFAGIDAALEAKLIPLKLNCIVKKNTEREFHAEQVKKYAAKKGLKVRFIQLMNFTSGDFSIVSGGSGGDCKNCNRLRLLCDGRIVPCLFSDLSFDTKTLGIKEALLMALKHKPQKGLPCIAKDMREIGG